jgi:hypothetical protein
VEHRVGEAVQEVERVPQLLLGGREQVVGELVGVSEHRGEVGGGLPVPTGRGRLARGAQSVRDDRVGVAGPHRMVHETRGLRAGRDQRGEHLSVLLHLQYPGEGLLDGAAHELVPEPHVPSVDHEDPVALGLDERGGGVWQQLAGHRELHPTGHNRQAVDRGSGGGGEALYTGEHRVTHGVGQCGVGRGEHLRDEERIAAGDGGHADRVEVGRRPSTRAVTAAGDSRSRRTRCTPDPTKVPSMRRSGSSGSSSR